VFGICETYFLKGSDKDINRTGKASRTWDTNGELMFSRNIKSNILKIGGPGSNPGLVMWDFVMDKSGAGAGFLRERQFPLPICFSTIIFTIIQGWHNRPGVAAVPIASQTK
jgi:hypothetical protein